MATGGSQLPEFFGFLFHQPLVGSHSEVRFEALGEIVFAEVRLSRDIVERIPLLVVVRDEQSEVVRGMDGVCEEPGEFVRRVIVVQGEEQFVLFYHVPARAFEFYVRQDDLSDVFGHQKYGDVEGSVFSGSRGDFFQAVLSPEGDSVREIEADDFRRFCCCYSG